MNWETISNRCESTPFKVIDLGSDADKMFARIDLYWTARRGVHGYQVYGVLRDEYLQPKFYKSAGYGYCKESHVLELMFKDLGFQPKGHRNGGEISPKWWRNGNLYEVKLKDLEAVA